jgi:hypothetical protein
MPEVDAFGYQQSFDLVELKEVARVDGISPKTFSRSDDGNRRPVLLHRSDLHRGGMWAQQQRVANPK